jgi:hypothetical protein
MLERKNKTRADFGRWKGIYETWLRRKEVYTERIQQLGVAQVLRVEPVHS